MPVQTAALFALDQRREAFSRHAAGMYDATLIPALPAPLGLLLRPLPLLPLKLVLRRVAESVKQRHPGLFLRLEDHAGKIFLIDPADLPFVFRLRPHPVGPVIEPRRRNKAGLSDARITGPLAALIGMVHGAYDGDALFFSRTIVIEGDTEAVLALRNALDDAEIDLTAEIAAAFGPVGTVIEHAVRRFLPIASRLTGLNLMRAGGF